MDETKGTRPPYMRADTHWIEQKGRMMTKEGLLPPGLKSRANFVEDFIGLGMSMPKAAEMGTKVYYTHILDYCGGGTSRSLRELKRYLEYERSNRDEAIRGAKKEARRVGKDARKDIVMRIAVRRAEKRAISKIMGLTDNLLAIKELDEARLPHRERRVKVREYIEGGLGPVTSVREGTKDFFRAALAARNTVSKSAKTTKPLTDFLASVEDEIQVKRKSAVALKKAMAKSAKREEEKDLIRPQRAMHKEIRAELDALHGARRRTINLLKREHGHVVPLRPL